MKQMEYTFKVVTDCPLDIDELHEAIVTIKGVKSADCTNYRVLPTPKAVKAAKP